jgi:hypothetical protein
MKLIRLQGALVTALVAYFDHQMEEDLRKPLPETISRQAALGEASPPLPSVHMPPDIMSKDTTTNNQKEEEDLKTPLIEMISCPTTGTEPPLSLVLDPDPSEKKRKDITSCKGALTVNGPVGPRGTLSTTVNGPGTTVALTINGPGTILNTTIERHRSTSKTVDDTSPETKAIVKVARALDKQKAAIDSLNETIKRIGQQMSHLTSVYPALSHWRSTVSDYDFTSNLQRVTTISETDGEEDPDSGDIYNASPRLRPQPFQTSSTTIPNLPSSVTLSDPAEPLVAPSDLATDRPASASDVHGDVPKIALAKASPTGESA